MQEMLYLIDVSRGSASSVNLVKKLTAFLFLLSACLFPLLEAFLRTEIVSRRSSNFPFGRLTDSPETSLCDKTSSTSGQAKSSYHLVINVMLLCC